MAKVDKSVSAGRRKRTRTATSQTRERSQSPCHGRGPGAKMAVDDVKGEPTRPFAPRLPDLLRLPEPVSRHSSVGLWEDLALLDQPMAALAEICNTQEEIPKNVGISNSAEMPSSTTLVDPFVSPKKTNPSSILSPTSKRSPAPDVALNDRTSKRQRNNAAGQFSPASDVRGDTNNASRNYHCIAHDQNYQNWFNIRNLSWGVRWEIARLHSAGLLRFDQLTSELLDKLKGSNEDKAPLVEELIEDLLRATDAGRKIRGTRLNAREQASLLPWKEMDREIAVLAEDHDGGLYAEDGTYGGKIQFPAKLEKSNVPGETFKICLERPTLAHSCRFTRQYGSHRFIRVGVNTKLLGDGKAVSEFFKQPFVLQGFVFRACYGKDNGAFLFQTNESLVNGVITSPGIDYVTPDGRISWIAFVHGHNPMECNIDKTMTKWAARMALGFSNSVPGYLLNPDDVQEIPDIISSEHVGPGKPPSEMEMTDGCGFITSDILRSMRERFAVDTFPIACQVRIGGAKGVVLMHPSGRNCEPGDKNWPTQGRVFLRDSQRKINYNKATPPPKSRLVIDVLRFQRLKSPAKLSAETITNLAENGVTQSLFLDLLKDGMQEVVNDLTDWGNEDGGEDKGRQGAMQRLWLSIARAGNIVRQRYARWVGGEARVRGCGSYSNEDGEDEDDEDEWDQEELLDKHVRQGSVAWWGDPISGCPSTLEETCCYLLDAGFNPKTCFILAEKLEQVFKSALNRYVLNYKISMLQSCECFIVPDPYGVLEPGEISIRSSRPLTGADGIDICVIEGQVLVTRHPCKVPTDVQRVKAVDRHELSQYTDVIVFSTKGKRSLASMLGGGDYDGDTVIAIWHPEFVKAFRDPDESFATPPADLMNCFIKDKTTVGDFLQQHPWTNPDDHIPSTLTFLLGSLCDTSLVGLYSNYHEKAVYIHGYQSLETKRMGYMFTTVLDGSKTGLKVRPGVLEADKKMYGFRGSPAWKELRDQEKDKNAAQKALESNLPSLERPAPLGRFIMDAIADKGRFQREHHIRAYKAMLQKCPELMKLDADLAVPWQEAEDRAKRLDKVLVAQGIDPAVAGTSPELQRIREHVESRRHAHRGVMRGSNPTSPKRRGSANSGGTVTIKSAPFTKLPIERRQDVLREQSEYFVTGPSSPLLYISENEKQRLMASYAYFFDMQSKEGKGGKPTRFPWDVAMRELCEIKARALGQHKPMCSDFYELMQMTGLVKSLP